MRGEHVLHLGLPASQPPIDTQAPTEGQQDNSSNTAALCREQRSILITNMSLIFLPYKFTCRVKAATTLTLNLQNQLAPYFRAPPENGKCCVGLRSATSDGCFSGINGTKTTPLMRGTVIPLLAKRIMCNHKYKIKI